MRRRAWLIFVACAILAVVSACGGAERGKAGTFFGAPGQLGNGTVRAFVTTDATGQPSDIGIQMSATALDGLPTQDTVPPTMTVLDFPEQASSTDFDHVMLNWNSHGHPPLGVFDKPHFDFHFYMTNMASVMAIDPHDPHFGAEAAHLPDAKYVPAGYGPELGPPAVTAVPAMGLHWEDDPDAFIPHHYNFTQVLINGSWDGRYTFIEPMITRDWLLTRPPAIQGEVNQPRAYQRSGYFPTTYRIRYDGATNAYDVSLGGLMMHPAS
ncbi:MAG TPA: DUF5602 domain-containing protein [Pseudonocardia sp.]|uniref:DUF5602 domain-containing protein n=1 Tax=Pseudonocardia sp. TaxID=60912 RepID=UPI002C904361|nr:DUF5602 domain-containing protein [Pseudonocardia sp.]HTF51938.1 DUF5602 domain-containing protein [Pseudonocardia sp.]